MSIRIVTDSACDLPDELVERHGIEVVPLNIRFGDEENALRGDLECRFTVDVSDLHPVLVGALRTRRRPRSPEPIR